VISGSKLKHGTVLEETYTRQAKTRLAVTIQQQPFIVDMLEATNLNTPQRKYSVSVQCLHALASDIHQVVLAM
jgi:hypothetical protein